MRIISAGEEMRALVQGWRRAGRTVAFVPTMGNLHEGHMSLVALARARADIAVASVFVNPLQFGRGEDLVAYPRSLEQDRARLAAGGAQALFVPSEEEIYPRGLADTTRVEVPGLGDILCGAHRPGHFGGVATVVNILLNLVRPDLAVFGEKDYQQLLIIKRMVADLRIPVEVLSGPIHREADGLAMSSRNGYLSADERAAAPLLHRTLAATARRIVEGEGRDRATAEALEALSSAGFRPDYLELRRASDLAESVDEGEEGRLLVAAWLGQARLIDNVALPGAH